MPGKLLKKHFLNKYLILTLFYYDIHFIILRKYYSHNKSKLRNQMNIDTLNNHLMILLNGPEIEDFDFEKVYEHWVNKKPRKSSYESES